MTFAPDVSFTLLEIEINDDGLVEETETFEVTISSSQGGVRIDDGMALVAIVDNDGKLTCLNDACGNHIIIQLYITPGK